MTKIKYTGIAVKATPKSIMAGPGDMMTGMMTRNIAMSVAAIAMGIINCIYIGIKNNKSEKCKNIACSNTNSSSNFLNTPHQLQSFLLKVLILSLCKSSSMLYTFISHWPERATLFCVMQRTSLAHYNTIISQIVYNFGSWQFSLEPATTFWQDDLTAITAPAQSLFPPILQSTIRTICALQPNLGKQTLTGASEPVIK